MNDKLRELARKMKTFRGDVPQEAVAYWINELLALIDAEGDGVAVGSMRALLIKALTDYRCTRTVDEDGEPLPLVDALSPGEGGTIQPGIEEIEFLAEYLADELPLPATHPARSGVVSDEDVDAVAKMISDRVGNGMREKYEALAKQIAEHFAGKRHD